MASTNSTSFSYLSTTNARFTGLASGLDIESIVEKLMKAESAKMEKLQQQKQKVEWQRDAYRSVNSKLESFRTDAFDNFKASTFSAKSATVSNNTHLDAVATASASGQLVISSVESLAGIANAVSSASVTVGSPATIATKQTTLGELGLSTGTLKLDVYKTTGATTPTTISIDYSDTDTIETLTKKINAQGGVTAVFGTDGKFSLTSTATGSYAGGTIKVNADSGGLLNTLNITSTSIDGKNAKYTLNGVEMQAQSNSFTESGYNISLKSTFNTTADVTNGIPTVPSVTISSKTDTDAIVKQVTSFIDLYNGLVNSLATQVKQKKDYNYPPLTDAQKTGMSADEIAKWEVKAQQGQLRNDSTISSVLSKFRASIYEVTTTKDSKYNSLYNIGITTSKDLKNGELVIKEDKLRAAIEANPEAVADLFTRVSTTDPNTKKVTDPGGAITQLRAIAKEGIDKITKKAGKDGYGESTYTLGKNISSLNTQILSWKDRLIDIETRYFKQFSAMESAIQKANSQSSIFAG